ncbi:MAG: hypothetical protein KF699_15080 [Phycisphaeraceae bacterium]|nr:hypothetical protein [Phycisphaeraceae bacterium]
MNRSLRRLAFWAYTAALLYGTHGPRRDVDVPGIDRPDLVVHLFAFGGWFVLLLATEYIGPWRAGRSLVLCALIGAAFAAVNESTQALPVFARTAAWDDYLANLGGIAAGMLLAWAAARVWPARPRADGRPDER